MLRTIYGGFVVVAAAIATLPGLWKLQKKGDTLSPTEYGKMAIKTTRKFGRRMIGATGTTVEVHGAENIPQDGGVLIVSNHQSNYDIPLLLGYFDRSFGFVSKVEMKKVPIVKQWMIAMKGVFIDRGDRRQSLRALQQAVKYMKEGYAIVIFPEGTRSQGPTMGEFKAGSLKLAESANVPILPVAINGTYRILEGNENRIKSSHVVLTVLPPVHTHLGEEKADMHELTNTIRNQIQEAVRASEQKAEKASQ